jgi:hypothetical protein
VAGALLGWGAARVEAARHRAALFHRSARRRLGALVALERRTTPEAAALLRDYVAWERHRGLRQRALRQLRRLEQHLA